LNTTLDHAESPDLRYYYPDFSPAAVPSGTSARRAWIGSIQPFADDESSRLVLRAIEANRQVQIDKGVIRAISYPQSRHPLEEFLTSMRVSFRLLLLEFVPPVHPRAYGLAPRISQSTFPAHPHLRRDLPLDYGGTVLPALCVYSAAEFRYRKEVPLLVEFLDQTATFLAKQLVWIRTRQLFEMDRLVYAPAPGDPILDFEARTEDATPLISRRPTTRVWRGYWPGSTAPAGPVAHIETVKANSECWCGRGLLYRNCHLPHDRLYAKQTGARG
jgi:hypothetical protein